MGNNTSQEKTQTDHDSHLNQEAPHVHGPNCRHHHSLEPLTRTQPKVGRNDPCPCGSEKKFKKCCG